MAPSPPPESAALVASGMEVFAALFLDARHRVIAFEPLFRSTVGGASVHPREVVRRLRGFRHLAKVIEGVRFNDGIEVIEDRRAAA